MPLLFFRKPYRVITLFKVLTFVGVGIEKNLCFPIAVIAIEYLILGMLKWPRIILGQFLATFCVLKCFHLNIQMKLSPFKYQDKSLIFSTFETFENR